MLGTRIVAKGFRCPVASQIDPVREERVRAPVETGLNGKVEKAEVRTMSYPDLVCRVHWIGAQRVMSTSPVRPAPDRDRDTDTQ